MVDRAHGSLSYAAAAALILILASAPGAAPTPRIVNGLDTQDFPSTGALLNGRGAAIDGDNAFIACSGTLIGCRTFLTAAHCVVGDLDPTHYWLYFQNAGIAAVAAVAVHPGYDPSLSGHDVALITLASDVTGIEPSPINAAHDLNAIGVGLTGIIAGFGQTAFNGRDYGIKRWGLVQTANCLPSVTGGESNDKLVCWDFAIPVGPPGQDSDTCNGDSGGPLFIDFGARREVVGVTSTGSSPFCRPLDHAWDASVYFNAAWIESQLGGDPTTTCGGIGPVGTAAATVVAGSGALTGTHTSDLFSIDVAAGATALRVALNGQNNGTFNPDLYVKQGSQASPSNYDCKADGLAAFGGCELANPSPGNWSLLVSLAGGAGTYQVTTTIFGSGAPIDTPTPTATPTEPAATPTPTHTPLAPTATATPTQAAAPIAISAQKLVLVDSPTDAGKRRIVFVSKDAAIDTSAATGIDPVASGATLQVYNANGSGESVCLALPSIGGSWKKTGRGGKITYKYGDPRFANGPCKVAVVAGGARLAVTCLAKTKPIAYSLDEPSQGAMAVRFRSGDTTWCALFGGNVAVDSGTDPPVAKGKGRFSATRAPAPASCPPAPACP